MGDFVGIALSGVPIGAALNADNEDPFYPPAADADESGDFADVCGQHSNGQGALHYHYMPQCLSTGSNSLYTASSIADFNTSGSLNRTWAGMQGFTSSNGL